MKLSRIHNMGHYVSGRIEPEQQKQPTMTDLELAFCDRCPNPKKPCNGTCRESRAYMDKIREQRRGQAYEKEITEMSEVIQ